MKVKGTQIFWGLQYFKYSYSVYYCICTALKEGFLQDVENTSCYHSVIGNSSQILYLRFKNQNLCSVFKTYFSQVLLLD
jgi:hypothetical protein